jgi:hypothetical protein
LRKIIVPVTSTIPANSDSDMDDLDTGNTNLFEWNNRYYIIRNPLYCYISSIWPESQHSLTTSNSTSYSSSTSSSSGGGGGGGGSVTADVSIPRIACIFICSVACVGVLANALVGCIEAVVALVPLQSSTVAATVMALGSEVRRIFVHTHIYIRV